MSTNGCFWPNKLVFSGLELPHEAFKTFTRGTKKSRTTFRGNPALSF